MDSVLQRLGLREVTRIRESGKECCRKYVRAYELVGVCWWKYWLKFESIGWYVKARRCLKFQRIDLRMRTFARLGCCCEKAVYVGG